MHRIGRTGRAEHEGKSILFYTEKEEADKEAIELLMGYEIPTLPFPEEVTITRKLTPEEQPVVIEIHKNHKQSKHVPGPAFHEKKEKNQKENQGGSYKRTIEAKYKKPRTRGDKNQAKKNKRR